MAMKIVRYDLLFVAAAIFASLTQFRKLVMKILSYREAVALILHLMQKETALETFVIVVTFMNFTQEESYSG